MRIACVHKKTNIVVNVLEVDSLDQLPPVVGMDDQQNPILLQDTIIVPTTVGSVGDLYKDGYFLRVVSVTAEQPVEVPTNS